MVLSLRWRRRSTVQRGRVSFLSSLRSGKNLSSILEDTWEELDPNELSYEFASSASSVLFYSTGFARPSRAITSARFGSDLNIETLVAAAERKETPLEPPKHLTCPTKTREALNICKSAVTTCS